MANKRASPKQASRKPTLTEQEWLEGANPFKMVSFLRESRASERKLRLFGCGCCRRVWNLLPDDASRNAVTVAERFADKLAKRKDLTAAYQSCGGDAGPSYNAAAAVVKVSLEWATFWAAHFGQCLAAGTEPIPASQLAEHHAAQDLEGQEQVKLLYDIFGNPFRPVTIAPSWLSSSVVALAQTNYDRRDFEQMPNLGKALEEGGCTDAGILEHCRGPGPHVRGCWLIDSLLGRK